MIPIAVKNNEFTSIDVAALPERNRFGFWSEVICKNFCPSENATPVRKDNFHASLRGRSLGSIGVCTVDGSPLSSSRTQQSLRQHPLDCFFVSLLQSGTAKLSQSGRRAIQKPGEFLMYDSARPFLYEMTSDYRGIWLRLPRQMVSTRIANAEAKTARVISTTSPLGRLVGIVMTEAAELQLSGDSTAAGRIGSSTLDILSAAFDLETAGSASFRGANMLDNTKAYILANLEDPELSTETLVKSLGVSRRTLSRLFATEGTTPIRWLWQQRLMRSKVMLENRSQTRVTDVALNCGFSDFSHFSRAFKAEFGMSPKALLLRN